MGSLSYSRVYGEFIRYLGFGFRHLYAGLITQTEHLRIFLYFFYTDVIIISASVICQSVTYFIIIAVAGMLYCFRKRKVAVGSRGYPAFMGLIQLGKDTVALDDGTGGYNAFLNACYAGYGLEAGSGSRALLGCIVPERP